MAGRMNRLLAVLISAVTVTSSVNFTAMGTKAAEGVNNVKETVEADTRSGNSGAVLHSFEAPLVGNSPERGRALRFPPALRVCGSVRIQRKSA